MINNFEDFLYKCIIPLIEDDIRDDVYILDDVFIINIDNNFTYNISPIYEYEKGDDLVNTIYKNGRIYDKITDTEIPTNKISIFIEDLVEEEEEEDYNYTGYRHASYYNVEYESMNISSDNFDTESKTEFYKNLIDRTIRFIKIKEFLHNEKY